MGALSHFDERGASRMVVVSGKAVTLRTARASGLVRMEPATLSLIRDRRLAKGDVFEVARLAGILAAKRTGELIPLCHPLGLDSVELTFAEVDEGTLQIEATVKVEARTGVEMEALTAVSIAALTVYDMCKALDRRMVIDQVRLEEEGGRPERPVCPRRRPEVRTFLRREREGSDDRSPVVLAISGNPGIRGSVPGRSELTGHVRPRVCGAVLGSGGIEGGLGMSSPVAIEALRRNAAEARGDLHSDRRRAGERKPSGSSRPSWGSRFGFVQQLVDHCADFRGKRLRPAAFLLLSGQACGALRPGASGACGGR